MELALKISQLKGSLSSLCDKVIQNSSAKGTRFTASRSGKRVEIEIAYTEQGLASRTETGWEALTANQLAILLDVPSAVVLSTIDSQPLN